MNKKVLSLICTGAVSASIIISSVFAAPADRIGDRMNKRPPRPPAHAMTRRPQLSDKQKARFKEKRFEFLKERINALVSEGKISQEDADAALAILNSEDKNINFGNLPDSVKQALMPKAPKEWQRPERPQLSDEQKAQSKEKHFEFLKERINALVSEGKISQEDADAALAILNSEDKNINFGNLPDSVKQALRPKAPKEWQRPVRPQNNGGQKRGNFFKNNRANCKPR